MTRTIFLLDDDRDEYDIFRTALRRIDPAAHLEFAADWTSARKQLSELSPSMIFIDYNMPQMDGLRCLQEIRAMSAFEATPVYIYSTGISDHDGSRALEMGATDYIRKPAYLDELCNVLRRILIR